MEYNVTELCAELKITPWTLTNWYQWERLSLLNGDLTEKVLPIPFRQANTTGRPRSWSEEQLQQLREFQKTIVRGRNGLMGRVTNPKSRQKKH